MLASSMLLGRIQLVAKDPSFDPNPRPDGMPASGAVPGASTGPVPDAAWNKDIRDYYNAVMQEPVPRELLDLLARIATDKTE